MDEAHAEALAAFRAFNYEHIYLRDASVAQGEAVVNVLRALVDHYIDQPNQVPDRRGEGLVSGEPDAVFAAPPPTVQLKRLPTPMMPARSALRWRKVGLRPRGRCPVAPSTTQRSAINCSVIAETVLRCIPDCRARLAREMG